MSQKKNDWDSQAAIGGSDGDRVPPMLRPKNLAVAVCKRRRYWPQNNGKKL